MQRSGGRVENEYPACYTHTHLTWWEANADRPVAVEINGQRYQLTALPEQGLPREKPLLLEPVLSAHKGILLRLLQEWENASVHDCERALESLPEAEDLGLPEDLVLELVVALARFYHLRRLRLTARGETIDAALDHVGSEVA